MCMYSLQEADLVHCVLKHKVVIIIGGHLFHISHQQLLEEQFTLTHRGLELLKMKSMLKQME